MKLRKLFLFLAVFCILLPLEGCAPAFPKLTVTSEENEQIQPTMFIFEVPIEASKKELLKMPVKPSLKKLFNGGKIAELPVKENFQAEITLRFTEQPDSILLDEYWVFSENGKYTGITQYDPPIALPQGQNPVSFTMYLHLSVPKAFVVDAVFGERRVVYTFILRPNEEQENL